MRSTGYSCTTGPATVIGVTLLALLITVSPSVRASDQESGEPSATQVHQAERTAPVTPFVIDIDLRDLPTPREWQPGDPIRDVPKRRYLPPGITLPDPIESRDALVDLQLDYSTALRGADGFTTPSRNFSGIPFTGAGVPDTIGDVGLNHIIQATNGGGSRIQIWDKATPTPSLLSTFTLDSLGTGACANGLGDPVIIYDRNADRWVMMEFVSGGNSLCVYISQTPDPVSGGWYAYDFLPPSFPDYPKLGVWPTDANQGSGSYIVTANSGVDVFAMERGPMLTGQAAGFQIFNNQIPGLNGFGFQAATPADIDGPDLPPVGAPALVMRQRDTDVHDNPPAPNDVLEIWAADIDWVNSANSSLTALPSIPVTQFSSEMCGLTSFSCIVQPNSGTTLDPLREVIMNRLQYIHHGGEFETLVGNFVVDVSGTDQGGIRWFELRRTGGGGGAWLLHQEGTYSIDSDSRWMGGSSMDQSGNIALGYNVSSGTTFPSLRYTGRKSTDPLGVMTATETPIVDGTSPSGTNRYGDYAAMGLDPADDCTFWFTGEYNIATTWSSRWVSFAFDQCGCLIDNFPVPTLDATADAPNSVELTWGDAPETTVTEYEVRRGLVAGGPYETIAVVADSSPGVGSGPDYQLVDPDVSGGVVYYYVVVASDGEACRSDAVNEVAAFPFGSCLLRPIFDGIVDAQIDLSATCGVHLDWNTAAPQCGSDVRYDIYRSTDPNFTPGPANLIGGGIAGTTALDQNGLVSGTEYHYVVRARDIANLQTDLNEIKISMVAGGSGGQETQYFEDFEDGATFADWTVTEGPGVHRCGEWDLSSQGSRRPAAGSGQYIIANSFDCDTFGPITSASVDSPAIDLSSPALAAVVLEFDLLYDHNGGEEGTVEVWDGSQWVVIWQDSNSDVNSSLSFDVSAWALGNAAFQVRFNYQGGNFDRWFSADNVRLGVDLICSTAPSPNPAPDGLAPTTPLRADRQTVAGDAVDVTWDVATCGSGVYNLLYGDLSNVGTYLLQGSECGIGNSGSFSWSSVPPGDLFFLIVGSDGAVTESSWGAATFGERNGLAPSGECGATSKTVTATCPAN